MEKKFLLALVASAAISTNIFAMKAADEPKKPVQGLQSEQIDRLSVLSDEMICILGEMVHGVSTPRDLLKLVRDFVNLGKVNKSFSNLLSIEDIACILKSHNIAVNAATGEFNRTALQLAASDGHAGCVRILLAAGADANAVNWNGRTALHLAAGNGHAECVRTLLEAGAAVDAKCNGWTALHLAAGIGHTECVRMLLGAGANVNAVDGNYSTALCLAVKYGHDDCVRALLEAGANVNDRCNDLIALQCAARNGHTECVRALLKAGANVNDHSCGESRTALHWAAREGHAECVRVLLGAGADIKATDIFGWTALQCAASDGHTECVRILRAAGAASYGHAECVAILKSQQSFLRRNACKIVSGAVAAAVVACAIAGRMYLAN